MLRSLAVVVIALCLGLKLFALSTPDGKKSWEVPVGSFRVHCSSGGYPVLWIASYSLNDVGHTLIEKRTTIVYNPAVLNGMKSDNLRLFWLGHECGHAFQQTSNESDADCWSARTGVKQHWFSMQDADQLEADLQNNPGDNNHATGPIRAAHVKECIRDELGPGQGSNAKEDPSDTFCQTVQTLLADSSNGYKATISTAAVGNGKGVSVSLPYARECRIIDIGRDRLNYICTYDPGRYHFLVKELTACLDNKNGYQKGSDDEYGTGGTGHPEIKIFNDEHGLDVIFSELNY